MSDDLVKRLREDQPVTQDMESTAQCDLQDAAANRIEELEAKLKEEIRISNKRGNMIEFDLLPKLHEAEAVLRDVDAWVDNLGLYAQEGHEPVAVFKRVKEVLSSE